MDFDSCKFIEKANAELIEMAVYRAKISDKSDTTKLKTLLKGGAIDEFIFSAPEDLIALHQYFPDENELKNNI